MLCLAVTRKYNKNSVLFQAHFKSLKVCPVQFRVSIIHFLVSIDKVLVFLISIRLVTCGQGVTMSGVMYPG